MISWISQLFKRRRDGPDMPPMVYHPLAQGLAPHLLYYNQHGPYPGYPQQTPFYPGYPQQAPFYPPPHYPQAYASAIPYPPDTGQAAPGPPIPELRPQASAPIQATGAPLLLQPKPELLDKKVDTPIDNRGEGA